MLVDSLSLYRGKRHATVFSVVWLRYCSGTQALDGPPKKNHGTKALPLLKLHALSPQGGLKFQHIAGLYSDLLGVDLKGRLHGWSWQSHLPHSLPLTLEGELGLEGEKIRLIAAKVLRASILTESGKVQWNFTHT